MNVTAADPVEKGVVGTSSSYRLDSMIRKALDAQRWAWAVSLFDQSEIKTAL
jgi:hypothetical protein